LERIKIYFASDSHLGIPDKTDSFRREKLLVSWLDEIKKDATEIYLLGDIFDFWFEYKRVVPKGYVRLLGKLAEITDSGIPVHYFIGNHDMWMKDYFLNELNIRVHRQPLSIIYNGFKFFIAHGDGLGPGDFGYKILKNLFRNKACQWMFARLHPNFAIWLADFFSGLSRKTHEEIEKTYMGDDRERLLQFVKSKSPFEDYDFYIMGHRHLPLDININNKCRYINTGDWIRNFSFAVFDGKYLELKKFIQA
jgi:UDP-2,3-diacylglucosamine hydrolase